MENLVNSSPLILVLVFLVIGFVFLMKGADFFVEGSSSIAKRLKVPPIIIGLTIVAMGTSLPETAVSVTASLVNNNELAVSNVVGSNIFNLMVVVGVCSILTPILVQKETIRRDIPFSMICALLLLGLGILAAGDTIGMRLGHLDGMILLGFFAGYIVVMIQSAMKARAAGKNVDMEGMEELEEEIGILSWPKSILFIVGGALAIAFGGDLTVDAARRIANEPDTGGTDHCFHRNFPSGAGDFRGCSQKERSGYGCGKCGRLQYFQYPDGSRSCICHQSGGTDPGKYY